jgi:hypothetical protein
MRLLTPVIQKIGIQKIVFIGSIKGLTINSVQYEVRDNGAVSYFFVDTSTLPLGRVVITAKDENGVIKNFAFNLQDEPVNVNNDVLNSPLCGYKTDSRLDNDSLQQPFSDVDQKFDALLDNLRRQGFIV